MRNNARTCLIYTSGSSDKYCKQILKSPYTSVSFVRGAKWGAKDPALIDSTGTDFETTTYSCMKKEVPNTCTCANGVGATGDACTSADSEICASCNDGHHLADSITCVPNNCNCANGVGMADGVACPSHNSETCASCNDNYQLAGNVCVTCCANGVPAEGECKCASCNDGYQLAENVCVIPVADFLGKFFDTESEACNYCRTRDVPMMSPTCDKCMSVPKVVGDNTKHMMFCDSTPSNEPYVCHQRGCKCKDDDTCEVIAANVEDCPQQPEPGYWTDTDKTDTDKLVPKSTQHAPHKWLN